MMISPETYIEMNIVGKTEEEVKKEIQKLKRRIKKLEKSINEEPPIVCMSPGPDVQLIMSKEYLKLAEDYLTSMKEKKKE